MAIEKLTLVNVVGKRKDVNTFAKDIYLFNDVQIVNAINEVESGRYTLPVTEENVGEILGMRNLLPNSARDEKKDIEAELKRIQDLYDGTLQVDFELLKNISLNTEEIIKQARKFNHELEDKMDRLNFVDKQLSETEKSIHYYKLLEQINIPMRELNNLKYFSFELGTLTKDNANRLKLIYPSIPSVIFHIDNDEEEEQIYLVVNDNNFKTETDRVLKALDFKPIEGFDVSYQRSPSQIVEMLEGKKIVLEREKRELEEIRSRELDKITNEANLIYNELNILQVISFVKSYIAFGDENFYFSGWIPVSQKDKFKDDLTNKDLKILYQEPEDKENVPTKLKNNWLFKPFEQLVLMYGVPNYLEIDPTPFFSLTYILFFGYMFGDVGQGLVLLLAGWIAEKKGMSLGGVASRVAIASIIFGFLYGSVFGVETWIPALWIKPMQNTTTLLITAVVVGVIMLIISYIYSLINKRREHETEEEYFGKNGYSGFFVYLLVLTVGLMMFNYIPSTALTRDIIIAIIVILTLMVFLAVPLMNLIKHRKFSYDVKGEYYISSFFEVFEMYLSMLSNTLSFIRVGAFALTHVGMFMAFQTIAEMAGGGLTGVIILIIGNIFILVLEGLIDFIQCLRLEFYELFGKYYEGDGVEFLNIQEEVKKQNSI